MKITIEPEAAEYVRSKGGHLVLYLYDPGTCGCGCGCGSPLSLQCRFDLEETDISNYRQLEMEGVNLYVDPEAEQEFQAVRIWLESSMWKSLKLETV